MDALWKLDGNKIRDQYGEKGFNIGFEEDLNFKKIIITKMH